MKKIKKLVSIGLAVGTILSMLTLTGCGEKNEPTKPADQQFAATTKSSSQENNSDAFINDQKVKLADSCARNFESEIKGWLAEEQMNGNATVKNTEIKFSVDKGTATITSSVEFNKDILEEKIKSDFPYTFWAKVFIDSDGKCVYTIYVDTFTSVNEDELPTKTDFENGTFAWKDRTGMTSSGLIVGTNPKLWG